MFKHSILLALIILLTFSVHIQAHVTSVPSNSTVIREGINAATDSDSIPEGWYKGNTHTHSNQSDGDSPPEEIAARYRDLGYDFLVLTDHNVKVEFSHYSTPGYLCIEGEEMTLPSNHTNGLGLTSTISPGTIRENVEAVLAQDGVPHLNHPTYSGLMSSDVLSVLELELMEIYNFRLDDYDENIWDEVLTAGKRVFGVATDDCHILYSESGMGWIVVRADSLNKEDILDAIARGDFYASTGVILDEYYVDSLRVIVDSRNGDRIDFIGRNGQILLVVNDSYGEYVFDGSESYVRTRIRDSLGKYAWTQPVFLPGFDRDPYADDVVDYQGISAGSPDNILGPPYRGKVPANWEDYGARIETGGYLVLDMGEGEDIIDREGYDLYIEEVDSEDGTGSDDPYHVYVSEDTTTWVSLGEGRGDSYFELNGILDQVRYIKIEVSELNAEIEAVETNFIDPNVDWVVDHSGMSSGYPRYVLGSPTLGRIGDPPENYSVRIEVGGYLILDLGPDEEAVDGAGIDLYVEEVDSEDNVEFTDDPFILYGSIDQVHWTVIGHGLGDTFFDLEGQLSWVRYLKLEPVDTNIEIDGISVANLGANSPVSLTLSPDNGTVIIPPSGGSFGYTATLKNLSQENQDFAAWIMALLPGGQNFGPVLGPVSLTIPEGDSLSVHLTQMVPAVAPSGQYFYTGFVGRYPSPVWDIQAFIFIKE
jgi:predicted metal-dependent phosphoesterase TrpH